ncbi:MAG: hypothetical protein JSR63_02125 [Proteobacteria bacterium]|nr:hypothetical protein [Pseudomonadota bacterium]MBS0216958.1 hypothetical protein [Pseudomonadota bacterium]
MRPHVFPCALAVAIACVAAGCKSPAPSATAAPPLFETFGTLHRDIGSTSPMAQRYFDQGLRLLYGFNHDAAGRAFAESARLDPECAICVWGQSVVLGPNINMVMDPAAAAEATALARRAASLSKHAKPADRALIAALQVRYAVPAPADRKPLDRAYADAMTQAARDFPDDDDIATLHAESLMDLTPWAYWSTDGKTPGASTPTILAELERVLARNPQHIGAMHYYIHATEASATPQRALRYADTLAKLAPGSGHLVHMPAHTYIRVGRYHDATMINFDASTADAAFLAVCRGTNGIYPLGYVPHNWHFASMTAGLSGSETLALRASDQTALRADRNRMGTDTSLQAMQLFVVTPLFTQVRFGRWNDILAQSSPPGDLPFTSAIWRFARGMAHARTGDTIAAQADLAALRGISADPALAKTRFTNGADALVAVAVPFLQGEVLRAQGDLKGSVAALRLAATAEDKLLYDEPANWPLPVRPYLGAALLEAGDARAAADAYRQDLVTYPDNGWSLYGLMLAQKRLNDPAAADTEKRYRDAWQWADAPLTASRY